MKRRMQGGAGIVMILAVTGCMYWPHTAAPIYQDGFLTVNLEPNPAGAGASPAGGAQQALSAQQLADVLKGLQARKNEAIGRALLAPSEFEPVFNANELFLAARELQNGLKLASGEERVTFQIVRPAVMGFREESRGAIYRRGHFLYMTVTKFRASDRMEGTEGRSGIDFEVRYEPSDAVVQRQEGVATRLFGSNLREIIVDVRKVEEYYLPTGSVSVQHTESSVPARPPQPPPVVAPSKAESTTAPQTSQASSAVTVDALQRQVKELNEELVRLRQELEETKQLLADKVLELNRVQNKANGAGAGRK